MPRATAPVKDAEKGVQCVPLPTPPTNGTQVPPVMWSSHKHCGNNACDPGPRQPMAREGGGHGAASGQPSQRCLDTEEGGPGAWTEPHTGASTPASVCPELAKEDGPVSPLPRGCVAPVAPPSTPSPQGAGPSVLGPHSAGHCPRPHTAHRGAARAGEDGDRLGPDDQLVWFEAKEALGGGSTCQPTQGGTLTERGQRREDGSRTQPRPLRVLHPRPGLPGRGWALTGPNKAPSGPGSGERVGIPRHPSPCAHRGSCGQARLAPRLSQTTEGAKSQGCRPSQDPPRRETGFRPQGCRQPKGLLDSEKRINHLGVL